MRGYARPAITLALLTALGGCDGVSVVGNAPRDTPPGAAPDPDATRAVGPVARDASRDRPVRRLSNAEISAALVTLLGARVEARDDDVEPDPELLGRGATITERYEYPPDPTVGGFDNNADALAVSPEFLSRHLRAVEAVVDDALARPDAARSVVGCDAPADDACLRRFVLRFGERAYRRPLSPEEFDDLYALARAAPREGNAGAAAAATAALMSPAFLYHMATGPAGEGGAQRLSGYDRADRLASLLWGALPDGALLDAAARGELDTPEGVEARAARMLADPRAKDGVQRFAERWLRIDHIRQQPFYTEQLHPELRERYYLPRVFAASLRRAVEELALSPTGDLLDLVDTRAAWVTPTLSYVLGARPDLPSEFDGYAEESNPAGLLERVTLPPSLARAGLLSHPAVLYLGGNTTGQVSPVARGLYVREVLLCESTRAPPPGTPQAQLREGDTEISRDELERHRAEPACASCHARLDPVGLGLERFDNLGMLLPPVTPRGAARTGRGRVEGIERPDFEGPVELAARLRAAPQVRRCVVTQYLRHALGRLETPGDEALVGEVDRAFDASGRRFAALVRAVVRSDAFLTAPREEASP